MTFREAQLRLLGYVVDRIHNGELTERGLARRIGISQPHAHNVLKGIRSFSLEISDVLLKYFNLSILDLASLQELEASWKKRSPAQSHPEAPFLDGPVGPARPWPASLNWGRSCPLPLPAWRTRSALLFAELAEDPYMYESLARAEIALLDISETARADLSPLWLYVISRGGEAVIRHIRPGARGFYLVTDAGLENPAQWEYLRMLPRQFADLVKARVLWVGRERDLESPEPQPGRLL